MTDAIVKNDKTMEDLLQKYDINLRNFHLFLAAVHLTILIYRR